MKIGIKMFRPITLSGWWSIILLNERTNAFLNSCWNGNHHDMCVHFILFFYLFTYEGLMTATSKKMKLDDFGDTFYQKVDFQYLTIFVQYEVKVVLSSPQNFMFCIEEFNKSNYTPIGHQATK
jgi:hypothetical protein